MALLDPLSRLRRRGGPAAPAPPAPPAGDGAPAPYGASGSEGSSADPLAASEMSFIDHLEALRWHLFKGLGGVVVATVVAFFFASWIVENVLMAPSRPDFWTYRTLGLDVTAFTLQNRTISGQFFAYMGSVLAVGAILGLPILLYQLWKFVEPGLYPHERQGLRFAAVGASFFFLLGVAFGYYFIVPLSLQFFAGFELAPGIANEFDITKYFGMITLWSFGCGLLFELPVVVYFLAKLGVVTAEMLRKSRKIAIVVILIVAAFITPPDPFSQVLVSLPLFLLYELSIVFAARTERQRARRLAAETAADAAEEAERAAREGPAEPPVAGTALYPAERPD